MEYRRLGTSGLVVSRICLGCMTYATPDPNGVAGSHPWTLDEKKSRPFIKRALDLGITFFDTANVYGKGSSEEIVGKALRDYARREDIVLATKVRFPIRSGPYGQGLSRKAIMNEIDASLRRLGTEYVDLYQIHRWDDQTPIEETLQALDDVVRSGKARYIGASNTFAWQLCKALYVSKLNGWTHFISMQNHLNLLYREEEREMLGLCADQGIGIIPWSPLARGRLARPWSDDAATERESTDKYGKLLYDATAQADRAVVERVGDVSQRIGVPRSQVALAWLLAKPAVTAPIVGATKLAQLDDAVAALDVALDADDIAQLEEAYRPHPIAGG